MKIPNQSTGVARNLCSGVELRQQASRALMPAQMRIRRGDGREPEPDGLPEETTRCRPCNPNGFQQCTTYVLGEPVQTFTRACTSCGPCQFVLPVLVPGQPVPPAALQFTQQCVTGGNISTRPCSRCSPETRIDLPWPASDRCIQFCCTGLDPTSCSVSVRTC